MVLIPTEAKLVIGGCLTIAGALFFGVRSFISLTNFFFGSFLIQIVFAAILAIIAFVCLRALRNTLS